MGGSRVDLPNASGGAKPPRGFRRKPWKPLAALRRPGQGRRAKRALTRPAKGRTPPSPVRSEPPKGRGLDLFNAQVTPGHSALKALATRAVTRGGKHVSAL